jgi:predicted transposase YdaD
MRESTTYQAILEEGRQEGSVEEARKLLLSLGSKKLGKPSERLQAKLAKIADLNRLETLIMRVDTTQSWQALLVDSNRA